MPGGSASSGAVGGMIKIAGTSSGDAVPRGSYELWPPGTLACNDYEL